LDKHKALYERILDGELNGGGFSSIASLNLITAIHFEQQGNAILSKEEISNKVELIFKEKAMPIAFSAEYHALLGDSERAISLLKLFVNGKEVVPIGRYYPYFKSPAFSALREDIRFLDLEEKYRHKLSKMNRELMWEF
tara:strand:+ start:68 stop:484 length:417 start_codon:yes stop_codon:yes gene_type:complete